MDWNEVSIFTTTEGLEPLCALLDEQGVEGYVIEDAKDFEQFLTDTEIYWDYVDEDLVREKTTQETTVKIYLEDSAEGQAQLARVKAALDRLRRTDTDKRFGRLETALAKTKQEDWEWGWKKFFKPFPVGRTFEIKPSWEEIPADIGERRILEIDPASSFGTGSHDTTKLCIMALEDTVRPGDRLLDMGTGSGILAIAAAMLGAVPECVTDIDANCLRTAQENAQKNHVSIGRGVCGDVLRAPELVAELGENYDIIVANIVADVLIGMAPLFRSKLRAGGTLICSGILNERAPEVEQALLQNGFSIKKTAQSDDWTAITAAG